jgi:hypothetical protein
MSATERSHQRGARLAAKAVAAEVMRERLATLRAELGADGLSKWADRVDVISRIAALKAVAEYVRRSSSFFVAGTPRVLDPETRSRHMQRVTALAGEIDKLADAAAGGPVTYQPFEAILRELHKSGVWPESSLVSEVARAFHRDRDTAGKPV